ncbi:MAG: hypothetical protein U5R49_09605 [Deltaproteobacteria bacterium]|nr:hypothetical protein [Deltaproteobacteria bacterium]
MLQHLTMGILIYLMRVFDEDRYVIFDTYEVLILCGTTVLKPTGVRETISKQDILIKYGVDLE